MTNNSVTLHRVLKATPEKVYRAFIEPNALASWIPPYGFLCRVHNIDVRVGGSYKMSFTNFTTGNEHSWSGKYLEIKPNEFIKYTDVFDDPNLPGEMITSVWLKKVSCGTELNSHSGRYSLCYTDRNVLFRLARVVRKIKTIS